MAYRLQWKDGGNTGQSISVKYPSVRGEVDVPSGKRTMKVFGAGNPGFLRLYSKFASSAQHHREKDHGCSNRSHPQRDKSVTGRHVFVEPMAFGVDVWFARKNGRNGILPSAFYNLPSQRIWQVQLSRTASSSRTDSSFLLQMYLLTICLQ